MQRESFGSYELDDAVGEALDKGVKLLGIAYPGGENWKDGPSENLNAYPFPRAFLKKIHEIQFFRFEDKFALYLTENE